MKTITLELKDHVDLDQLRTYYELDGPTEFLYQLRASDVENIVFADETED